MIHKKDEGKHSVKKINIDTKRLHYWPGSILIATFSYL